MPIFNGKRDYSRALALIQFYNFKDHPLRFSKFILLSNEQRNIIWNQLSTTKRRVDIVSYCLMPNHFHLLLKSNDDGEVSKFLADFQNSYTKYYNTKNSRTGHLLQGQFKAVHIESDEQLAHISRYIHLNPYSSSLISSKTDLNQYLWSSFLEYNNYSNLGMCEKSYLTNLFKSNDKYIQFVFDNADYQKHLEEIKHLKLE